MSDLTTLHVGGPVGRLFDAVTEDEFIATIREADAAGSPVLVLGGGSNLVVGDDGFPGVVVRDRRSSISVRDDDAPGSVVVTATAGTPFGDVVAQASIDGWVGVEVLSGIPGSVGATPVQNVGAYGQEVSDTITSVRTWDRADGRVRLFTCSECGFAYRTSIFKTSPPGLNEGDERRVWLPTPRYVILDVTFTLSKGTMSAPVTYTQLAEALEVTVGERAPLHAVRQAVLELRRSKGMVLDPTDHDTWSVGSFFTNPIVTAKAAERFPADTPRFPTGVEAETGAAKISAAWLIEHAGFSKGFALTSAATAALSTKHVLAITNRGGATAADVVALARHIRDGVHEAFGVTLEPEPVLVGVDI